MYSRAEVTFKSSSHELLWHYVVYISISSPLILLNTYRHLHFLAVESKSNSEQITVHIQSKSLFLSVFVRFFNYTNTQSIQKSIFTGLSSQTQFDVVYPPRQTVWDPPWALRDSVIYGEGQFLYCHHLIEGVTPLHSFSWGQSFICLLTDSSSLFRGVIVLGPKIIGKFGLEI